MERWGMAYGKNDKRSHRNENDNKGGEEREERKHKRLNPHSFYKSSYERKEVVRAKHYNPGRKTNKDETGTGRRKGRRK